MAQNVGGRGRRGEFNVLWAIVTIVGIVVALVLIYYVYGGASKSLSMGNTVTVDAQQQGGLLFINLKSIGISTVQIQNVAIYGANGNTVSCSPESAYLDGQSISASFPISMRPGDTLSLIYNCGSTSVATVVVVTSSGTYTASVT